MENATYLNLKKAAENLTTKNNNEFVTIGLDDSMKATGYKLYDVKADHIIVSGPDSKRKTLSNISKISQNVSHIGADGAAAYEYKTCHSGRYRCGKNQHCS